MSNFSSRPLRRGGLPTSYNDSQYDPRNPFQRRFGTARRDASGNLLPGEYNGQGQPIGQNSGQMSPGHDWSAFNKAFPSAPAPDAPPSLGQLNQQMGDSPADRRTAYLNSFGNRPSSGTVIDPGTSPFNYRGSRTVQVPGNPEQPSGGAVTEVDPHRDLTMNFLPQGDSLLPKASAGGVVIAPQYRTLGASSVGSVTRGSPFTATGGKIADETGNVTGKVDQGVLAQVTPPAAPVVNTAPKTPVGTSPLWDAGATATPGLALGPQSPFAAAPDFTAPTAPTPQPIVPPATPAPAPIATQIGQVAQGVASASPFLGGINMGIAGAKAILNSPVPKFLGGLAAGVPDPSPFVGTANSATQAGKQFLQGFTGKPEDDPTNPFRIPKQTAQTLPDRIDYGT